MSICSSHCFMQVSRYPVIYVITKFTLFHASLTLSCYICYHQVHNVSGRPHVFLLYMLSPSSQCFRQASRFPVIYVITKFTMFQAGLTLSCYICYHQVHIVSCKPHVFLLYMLSPSSHCFMQASQATYNHKICNSSGLVWGSTRFVF